MLKYSGIIYRLYIKKKPLEINYGFNLNAKSSDVYLRMVDYLNIATVQCLNYLHA